MKQTSTANIRNNFSTMKPSVIGTIHSIHTETISTIPNSPFPVREDPSMHELVESIAQFGILVPIEVRPTQPGRYEIISGSRRYHAATVISLEFIPAIILDLDEDEAIIRR